jgi:hypothetical protein
MSKPRLRYPSPGLRRDWSASTLFAAGACAMALLTAVMVMVLQAIGA